MPPRPPSPPAAPASSMPTEPTPLLPTPAEPVPNVPVLMPASSTPTPVPEKLSTLAKAQTLEPEPSHEGPTLSQPPIESMPDPFEFDTPFTELPPITKYTWSATPLPSAKRTRSKDKTILEAPPPPPSPSTVEEALSTNDDAIKLISPNAEKPSPPTESLHVIVPQALKSPATTTNSRRISAQFGSAINTQTRQKRHRNIFDISTQSEQPTTASERFTLMTEALAKMSPSAYERLPVPFVIDDACWGQMTPTERYDMMHSLRCFLVATPICGAIYRRHTLWICYVLGTAIRYEFNNWLSTTSRTLHEWFSQNRHIWDSDKIGPAYGLARRIRDPSESWCSRLMQLANVFEKWPAFTALEVPDYMITGKLSEFRRLVAGFVPTQPIPPPPRATWSSTNKNFVCDNKLYSLSIFSFLPFMTVHK